MWKTCIQFTISLYQWWANNFAKGKFQKKKKYLQATGYFINYTDMYVFYQEVQYLQLGLSICLIFL